jgi:hypothetical protein
LSTGQATRDADEQNFAGVLGDSLSLLGLRRVSEQNGANASQPWVCKMNGIQRVSTDFGAVLPGE